MQARLTAATIEDAVKLYPEEIRESVKQLYGYMMERCDGDRNRLVARLKLLGHDYSTHYFYKLFTGRWLENGEFVASTDKICAMARELMDNEKGLFVKGKFPVVETETIRLLRDAINTVRQQHRICKWLFVTGPSGSQKTFAAKYYATEYNHGSTIYQEAPFRPDSNELRYNLARRTGCNRDNKGIQQLYHIQQNITDKHCLIFDNAQRLYNEKSGSNQTCFSFLQKLQDETNCSIVLIFVRNTIGGVMEKDPLDEILFGDAKGFFAQFLGRIGGEECILRLPDASSDADLRAFAKAAGFRADDARLILPVMRYLDSRAGGLRIMLQALQNAALAAEAAARPIALTDFADAVPTEKMSDVQLQKLETLRTFKLEAK